MHLRISHEIWNSIVRDVVLLAKNLYKIDPKLKKVISWLIDLVIFVWLFNLVIFKFSVKLSKLTNWEVKTFPLFLELIF